MNYTNQIPPNPISNIINIAGNGYNQQQRYPQQRYQPQIQPQQLYPQPGYNPQMQQPQQNTYPQQYNSHMNNGGYYTSNYQGGYFNPYLENERMKTQQIQAMEQQNSQINLFKEMSRSVNKSLGYDITEEQINHIYNPQQQAQQQQQLYDPDRMASNNLANLIRHGYKGNPENDRLIAANNQLYERAREQCPNEMTYQEFAQQAPDILINIAKQTTLQKEKDLTNVYGRDSYRRVLNANSPVSNYFNSTFNNNFDSIDTLEVNLPDHLKKTLDDRKQAFFNSIYNK